MQAVTVLAVHYSHDFRYQETLLPCQLGASCRPGDLGLCQLGLQACYILWTLRSEMTLDN